MNKKTLKIVLILLGFNLTGLYAQQTIVVSGGNASGDGGSISFSVGQLFYFTITETSGSVAQGIQQPYEISSVIGIKDLFGIDLKYSIYPNPTSDLLVLKVDNINTKNLVYKLFDMKGNLIDNGNINGKETFISMKKLSPSVYFLQVLQAQGTVRPDEIKIFKIIKTQ